MATTPDCRVSAGTLTTSRSTWCVRIRQGISRRLASVAANMNAALMKRPLVKASTKARFAPSVTTAARSVGNVCAASADRLVTWAAQHLRFVANPLLKSLYSKEFDVTSQELDEMYEAISRRDGFRFLSRGAGFRPEHQKQYAERWDLRRLFLALRDSVSFHVLGSEGDIFEPNQVVKARERLGDHGLDIRMVPGGHLSTSEQPEQLARIIEEVGPA